MFVNREHLQNRRILNSILDRFWNSIKDVIRNWLLEDKETVKRLLDGQKLYHELKFSDAKIGLRIVLEAYDVQTKISIPINNIDLTQLNVVGVK